MRNLKILKADPAVTESLQISEDRPQQYLFHIHMGVVVVNAPDGFGDLL
jgi:hypothetical protein